MLRRRSASIWQNSSSSTGPINRRQMPPSASVPISQADLLQHLEDQIRFLEASADAYDNGFESEAKRLATAIRILVHDTRSSHSLLGQLGKKDCAFLSTAIEFDPNNRITHGGLVVAAVGGAAAGKYLALLDDVPVTRQLSFDEWWDETVFVDCQRRPLTRKQVILTAADQDGGAHVDPNLDTVYADLIKNNSLGWKVSDGVSSRAMEPPEKACIRQIAHELLKVIKPGYAKQPPVVDAELFVTGMSVVQGAGPQITSFGIGTPSVRKVRRNEPCPCGSGKKYKKCHGQLA
jgi:hypothetical protein